MSLFDVINVLIEVIMSQVTNYDRVFINSNAPQTTREFVQNCVDEYFDIPKKVQESEKYDQSSRLI